MYLLLTFIFVCLFLSNYLRVYKIYQLSDNNISNSYVRKRETAFLFSLSVHNVYVCVCV